jgi:hypothetical protein
MSPSMAGQKTNTGSALNCSPLCLSAINSLRLVGPGQINSFTMNQHSGFWQVQLYEATTAKVQRHRELRARSDRRIALSGNNREG